MPSTIDLILRIRAQGQQAVQGIGQVTGAGERFKAGVKGMAAASTIAIGGLVALGKAAGEAASRQDQAFGSLESVYGKNADQVKDWAKQSATSVGLSTAQYAEMQSKLGASLKNMGLSTDAAADKSKDLISLGADLSAAFGGTSADAVDALGSALRGEADPAERYGLALSQTRINAELAAKGQDKLTGAALQQAKAAAIVALATKQAGGAIGQFGRESGTAAGSAQIASAQFENAKASLGEALLPVLVAVSAALSGFAGFLTQNTVLVRTIALVIGGFAAAVIAVNVALKIYAGVQKLMAAGTAIATAAQWLWNAALSANPIGLIIIGIAAFVAAIVVLWNKSTGFRNFILGMWKAIQAAAAVAWNAIKAVISVVIAAVTAYIKAYLAVVGAVWDAIKAAASVVWNAIAGIIKGVIATVTKLWQTFANTFASVIGGVKSAASTVFEAVKTIISGIITGIGVVIGTIVGIAQGIWDKVKSGVDTTWALIKAGVIDPLQAAYTWVTDTFGNIATFFSELWQGIVNTASSILGGIGEAVSGAFSGVAGVIKSVINGIISFINGTVIWGINKLIDGANLIPFVDIPHVGNIPLIGSAPDGDLVSLFGNHGAGRAGSDYSTSIVVNGALDPDATAQRIDRIMQARRRRVGVLQIGATT